MWIVHKNFNIVNSTGASQTKDHSLTLSFFNSKINVLWNVCKFIMNNFPMKILKTYKKS